MPTIQTTYVCKSGKNKGKMLVVVLVDSAKPMIRTNKPATSEEIISTLRPLLKDNALLERFAQKLQQEKS